MLACEEFPDRRGDVAVGQHAAGNLVKERLEQMVVDPVHYHDLGRRVAQLPGRGDPGETTADDHHAGPTGSGDVPLALVGTGLPSGHRLPPVRVCLTFRLTGNRFRRLPRRLRVAEVIAPDRPHIVFQFGDR